MTTITKIKQHRTQLHASFLNAGESTSNGGRYLLSRLRDRCERWPLPLSRSALRLFFLRDDPWDELLLERLLRLDPSHHRAHSKTSCAPFQTIPPYAEHRSSVESRGASRRRIQSSGCCFFVCTTITRLTAKRKKHANMRETMTVRMMLKYIGRGRACVGRDRERTVDHSSSTGAPRCTPALSCGDASVCSIYSVNNPLNTD